MNYTISLITKDELRIAMLVWAKEEGWNYSRADVETYFSLNCSNIFALKVEGEFIGCIITTRYHLEEKNFSLGSVGLYLVEKKFRSMILNDLQETPGSVLWTKANELLASCTLACLNSVTFPRLLKYYKRKGFTESGYTSLHLSSHSFLNNLTLQNENVDKFSRGVNFNARKEAIISYENKLFSNDHCEREEFVNRWLERPDAIVVVYQDQDNIEGYGVLTVCSENEEKKVLRLSPAYADSIDVAAKIIFSLLAQAVKKDAAQIELNFPSVNNFVLEVLENYGFTASKEGDTYLMTTSQALRLDNNILLKTIALSPLEFPHESLLAIKM
jgi:Acetyltransferase (GNAT) domain